MSIPSLRVGPAAPGAFPTHTLSPPSPGTAGKGHNPVPMPGPEAQRPQQGRESPPRSPQRRRYLSESRPSKKTKSPLCTHLAQVRRRRVVLQSGHRSTAT